MLSWLRCFPHDAIERKARAATASSFRRKKSSPPSRDGGRITRCATTAAAPARQSFEFGGGGENENENVISARAFSFGELAAATGNFGEEKVIGEGGFGRVYRGTVEGSPVAVKQLECGGGDKRQGNREFAVEVLVLTGLLHHPNLVRLLGYCADGGHRLLVYRLMPLGSLHDHLHCHLRTSPLPWRTRMRIAHGAACGLRHLHDAASPPVIYRDLKPSNILLDHGYVARLSDFGLAKLQDSGDTDAGDEKQGTYGYCAPEYLRSGQLTVKSDVYSFGVVLLELITGRRPMEGEGGRSLVGWAAPLIADQARFQELLDPLLLLRPSARELNQAVAVAAMCLQEDVSLRPVMADVVMALAFLATT